VELESQVLSVPEAMITNDCCGTEKDPEMLLRAELEPVLNGTGGFDGAERSTPIPAMTGADALVENEPVLLLECPIMTVGSPNAMPPDKS
jgi:hypothetical protein